VPCADRPWEAASLSREPRRRRDRWGSPLLHPCETPNVDICLLPPENSPHTITGGASATRKVSHTEPKPYGELRGTRTFGKEFRMDVHPYERNFVLSLMLRYNQGYR
jgi:hypothetical protein